jgi:hypothetical protein
MFHHRPTTNFKQQNKQHKTGKHESKNALKRAEKGHHQSSYNVEKPKLGRTNNSRNSLKEKDHQLSKIDRKNRSKQIQKNKKEALISSKRLGHGQNAPKVVVLDISHFGEFKYNSREFSHLLEVRNWKVFGIVCLRTVTNPIKPRIIIPLLLSIKRRLSID